MANLLEYVGSIHIFLGPYRGNPIALYLKRALNGCQIAPKVYPWNDVVGVGETPNRAAADFEEKWKTRGLSPGKEGSSQRSQRHRNQPLRPSQPRLSLLQRKPRLPPHLENQTHPAEKPASPSH